jgi:excisionase family DNA binding protein
MPVTPARASHTVVYSLMRERCKKRKKEKFLEGEELLTVQEVAQILRVDDTTVRRWIKDGVLEAIALPHRGTKQSYRIRRKTIDNLVGS